MPVPTLISELSTTPGSNSPAGSDAPGVIDDHIRTVYAFIRLLSDEKLSAVADGSISTAKLADLAVTATKIANDAVTFAKLQNISTARFLGRTTAGTGDVEELTASGMFTAIKQAASTTATGVVELATSAEVQTGSDTTRAVTPSGFSASSLGHGQTWQVVTRTAGLTYTNTTGRPITLNVAINGASAACSTAIVIDGATSFTFANAASGTGPSSAAGSVVIPIGATYVLTDTGVSARGTHELR